MGTVYRASRDDNQFQQDVAIKIVKRGMDFAELTARFRRERQILARLDHPNIVRLLDGGATAEGAPYFVVEFVEGVPLTTFCAGRPLTENLTLFRQICGAVQYAHQNLIVHRDLKPGNILITNAGVPKLLDFGLAKLLQPDQYSAEAITTLRLLTPDYASPEQVRGEVIGTASDIYSLGAVLYEMISGRAAHRFESRLASELERVVCDVDPTPLAGELGNIVQMAMRKEPERRYATVEQFSEDIRRFLEGEPVLARKDTILYRAAKFLRRHRIGVAAAALAIAGLIGVTAFAVAKANEADEQRRTAEAASAKARVQAQEAESARALAIAETSRANQARALAETATRRTEAARTIAVEQAEQARRFAGDAMASVTYRLNQLPGTLKARSELAVSALNYMERLAAQMPGNTAFQVELAGAYLRAAMLQYHVGHACLYQFQPALDNLAKARAILTALQRREPENLAWPAAQAAIYHQTGITTAGLGRHSEALELLRMSATLAERGGQPPTGFYKVNASQTGWMIGWEAFETGSFQELIDRWPVNHVFRLRALAARGELMSGWKALKARVEKMPDPAPRRQRIPGAADSLPAQLAGDEFPSGQPAAVVSRLAAMDRRVFVELAGHPLKVNLGEVEAALRAAREIVTIWDAALVADPDNGSARHYGSQGRARVAAFFRETNPAEAVDGYRSAINGITALWRITPSNLTFQRLLAQSHSEIALPLRRLGRSAKAKESLIAALKWEAGLSEPRSFTRNEFGDLELEAGDHGAARRHYQDALDLAEARIKLRPLDMHARKELADTHERLGRYNESRSEWRQAHHWHSKSLEVWTGWTKHGYSSVYNERREKQARENVERCGRFFLTSAPE
jgi:tetratricopeptide (TPR) repeat protein